MNRNAYGFLFVPAAVIAGFAANYDTILEYSELPFWSWPSWKFCFILSFATMFILITTFAILADRGFRGELSVMFKVYLISVPLMTLVYKFLFL